MSAACKSSKKEKYFTGTIAYVYTYSSDSLDADSLTYARAGGSSFRYDLQDYQSRFTGKDTETWYYSGLRNKCIGKMNSEAHYSCEDYNIVTDTVLSWKLYDTDEKILGHACRVLEMQKGNSWVRYFISRELVIAPDTYRRHKSYNWNFYGEKAGGGLILKSEHRFTKFTMKGVATDITVKDKKFRALEISDTLYDTVCK
jgi:hypothetical protein